MSDAEKPEGEAKKPKAEGAPKAEKKAAAKGAPAPKADAPKKLKENKGDYIPRFKERYKKEIRAAFGDGSADGDLWPKAHVHEVA
jgi:hypothetical protein